MIGWITLIVLVVGLLVGMAFVLASPSKNKQDKIELAESDERESIIRHHSVPGEVVAVAPNGQYAYRIDNGTYRVGTIESNETIPSERIPHLSGESELATVNTYRLPDDTDSYASYSSDGMTRYIMPCKNYTLYTRALRSEDGIWYGLHSNLTWIRLDHVPNDSTEVHLGDALSYGVAVNDNHVVSILHRGVWTTDLRVNGIQSVDSNMVVLDRSKRVFQLSEDNGLVSLCRLTDVPDDVSLLSNDMSAIVSGHQFCKMFHLRDGSEMKDLLQDNSKGNIQSVAWNTDTHAVYLGQPGRVVELSVL